jgi:hypothetical protein
MEEDVEISPVEELADFIFEFALNGLRAEKRESLKSHGIQS